jgi:uncharacterized protein with HEPN domain
MSDRNARLLLEDMLEAIEKIRRYTGSLSFDAFMKDDKTIDAVLHNLQIIGEAANRLPEEFTEHHSDIEWYKIIGLRHRVVHDYFGVDLEIVWQILQHDLGVFESQIRKLV